MLEVTNIALLVIQLAPLMFVSCELILLVTYMHFLNFIHTRISKKSRDFSPLEPKIKHSNQNLVYGNNEIYFTC